MGIDNLKVEEHKDSLKKAKGENQENMVSQGAVTSVDKFIQTLKESARSAEKESKKTNKNAEKEEKRNNPNNSEEINQKYEKMKLTQVEKSTMVAFINNSPAIINAITTNLVINFEKIGKNELNAFDEAMKAFKEDMATFKNNPIYTDTMADNKNVSLLETSIKELKIQIDLKKIEMIPGYAKTLDKIELEELQKSPIVQKITGSTADKIRGEITEGVKANETKEKNSLDILLDSPPSKEIAKQLFETNKEAWDGLIKKNRSSTDSAKTEQQLKFEKLLEIYGGGGVQNYERKNFMNKTGITKGNRDAKYTYLEVNSNQAGGKEKKQVFMFGTTTDVIYKAMAEANKGETKWDMEKDIKSNLKVFDEKGSYAAFEEVIKEQTDPSGFLKNLLGKNLLEEINTYGYDTDKSNKINRYYGVILEHIANTKDEGLLTIYLNNIIVDNTMNLKYLGDDTTAQTENFNKIVKDWIIDPQSANGKKLEQIKGLIIKNVSPKNREESMAKGLDSLINTFGPLIFSIMKLLGIGKGTLLKRFGDNEKFREKINEMFSKEYKLSQEQAKDLDKVVNGDEKGKEPFSSVGFNTSGRPYSGKELKDRFDEKDDNNKTNTEKYMNRIMEGEHFKYMNVSVLQSGVDLYNKEKKQSVKMSDIVTTTIDTETKKETIKEIKEKEKFREIIGARISDEKTRTRIASANKEIQAPVIDKKIFLDVDMQGISVDPKNNEAGRYLIQSQKDIARYLTASLFSDKDLGFVMTENQLHNGKPIENNDITPKTPEERFAENRKKIDKNKIDQTKKKYLGFEFATDFDYKENVTGDQKEYQERMLEPLSTILTDKDQFPFLINNLKQETTKTEYDRIFTDPTHLSNMLTMIDKTLYADIISKLKGVDNATVTIDNGNIVLNIADKGAITFSQESKEDKIRLKADRKEAKTPAK